MTLLFPLHQIKGKYCIWKQINACEQSQIPLCRSQQKSKNSWIISNNNTNTKNTHRLKFHYNKQKMGL